MTNRRMLQTIIISFLKNGFKRAEYLKKSGVFYSIGDNCFWQPRVVPPEAGLISIGNNVVVASEVLFINHDVIHHVFSKMDTEEHAYYRLNLDAIEIGNNVFIGSRTIILPGSKIGDNVVIGAGTVVTGFVQGGGVYAGVPIRRIGDFDTLMRNRRVSFPEKRRKEERFSEVWEDFKKKYGEEE